MGEIMNNKLWKLIIGFLVAFNLFANAVNSTNRNGFVDVAKKILPATVVVQGNKSIPQRDIGSIFDVFEEFEGVFGKRKFRGRKTKAPKPKSKVLPSGSGFVVDCVLSKGANRKKGKYKVTVVTNYHVISSLSDYYVSLDIKGEIGSEKKYKANLLGFDQFTDLAVLEVFVASKIQPLEWCDSTKLQVGEYCIVAGAPMGKSKIVTAGIISHVSQSVYENKGSVVPGYVQFDAPVNGGNSGGPNCNIDGKVIGVVVFKVSHMLGEGMAYAVPSNLAKKVVNQIIKQGSVKRGWIGVTMQMLDDELALAFGLEKARGVLIRKVEKGPSYGKIHIGDILLEVNDEKIFNDRDVSLVIANSEIGAKLKFKVLRNGKTIIVHLTTQAAPKQIANIGGSGAVNKSSAINIAVSDLTEAQKNRFGKDFYGVNIHPKKNMSLPLPFKEGDIVQEIQGVKIISTKKFQQQINHHKKTGKNKPIVLKLFNPNQNDIESTRFATIRLG